MSQSGELIAPDNSADQAALVARGKRLQAFANLVIAATWVVVIGLLVWSIASGDLPTIGELAVWLLVFIVLGLAPFQAACSLIAIRGSGVDIRYIVVAPVAILRDGDRWRLIPSLSWFSQNGQVMPTSASVSEYLLTVGRMMTAIRIGSTVQAVLFVVTTLILATFVDASILIIGIFSGMALWSLSTTISAWLTPWQNRTRIERNLRLPLAWIASLRISAMYLEGTRPRDIDRALIDEMLGVSHGTPLFLAGRVTAATCLLDRGEVEEAGQLVDEALAVTSRGYGNTHFDVLLTAALIEASVRHHPESARALLKKAPGMSIDRYLPKMIEAVILLREGRFEAARIAAQAGLRLIPQAMWKGPAVAASETLEAVVEAADRELADRFTREVQIRRDAAAKAQSPFND